MTVSGSAETNLNSMKPLLIGPVLAALMLVFGFSSNNTDFKELALGKETQSYYALENNVSIHCEGLNNAEKCLQGLPTDKAVLWFGNSQLHAINQYRPGQQTAAPILYRWMQGQGRHFLTFSQPNASFQEHYVLFTYLKQRLDLNLLVIGAVFDDTREIGIRDDISLAFSDTPTATELGLSVIGRKILLDNKKVEAPGDDLAGIEETVQQSFESALNELLNSNFTLWAKRKQMRGELFNFLYITRNTLFRITPSTKRRMIKGRYELNLQALQALLESANKSGIKVLLYIAPLRSDVPTPYINSEYEMYKHDIQGLAAEHGASYSNIEDIIAGRYWGMKDATSVGGEPEFDFMHFNAAGHKIFANSLKAEIRPLLQ